MMAPTRFSGIQQRVLLLVLLASDVSIMGQQPDASVRQSEPVSSGIIGLDPARFEHPKMPTPDQLASIEVELFRQDAHLPELRKFTLRREHFGLILKSFHQPHYNPLPYDAFPDLGCLRLAYSDHRVMHITWCSGGKAPLVFSIGRTPCSRGGEYYAEYGDEGLYLYFLLRSIYQFQHDKKPEPAFDAMYYRGNDRFFSIMDNPNILQTIRNNSSTPATFLPKLFRVDTDRDGYSIRLLTETTPQTIGPQEK